MEDPLPLILYRVEQLEKTQKEHESRLMEHYALTQRVRGILWMVSVGTVALTVGIAITNLILSVGAASP